MIQKYLLLAIVGFSMFTVQSVLNAEPFRDQQQIQNLIEQVGKTTIIEVIMEIRNGKITITRGTGFRDNYGRPNKDYISAKTVAEDLKKANMDVSTLESEIELYISKKEQKKERWRRLKDATPSQEQSESKDGIGVQADSGTNVDSLKKLHKELMDELLATDDPDENNRLKEEIIAIQEDMNREMEMENRRQSEIQPKEAEEKETEKENTEEEAVEEVVEEEETVDE